VTQMGTACLCRWWACKPAPATTTIQTSLVLAAISGDQAAAAAAGEPLAKELVDMLVISHPSRAKRSSRVVVKVILNRQALPVPNTKVFVQVTTNSKAGASSTTTIASNTGKSGFATVALPAKAKGAAGSRSIIHAFTNDARASGVKGGVAILSQRGRLSWI